MLSFETRARNRTLAMTDISIARPKTPRPRFWQRARRHLRRVDPVMDRVIAEASGDYLRPRQDPFYSLARSIVGQQISVKAAESVWQKLCARAGVPTPAAITDAGETRLLDAGLSRQKVRYLLSLAEHFASGRLAVAAWPGQDDETIIAELTAVPGIGRWTAEMFLIFHLLRTDILPLSDLGVRRAMGLLYGDGGTLDLDAMERIAEPWRPWRSVATWYLWRSLDKVPVDY
jgi:DNA-3-methyladenine glycosylase II